MDDRRVLIDTSVFIEYFRKKRKDATLFYKLSINYKLYTSSICYFEYKLGSVDEAFEEILFSNITILSFTNKEAEIASHIFKELKSKNKIIEFRDIFIASTAISNHMQLATLNFSHFERIDGLELVKL